MKATVRFGLQMGTGSHGSVPTVRFVSIRNRENRITGTECEPAAQRHTGQRRNFGNFRFQIIETYQKALLLRLKGLYGRNTKTAQYRATGHPRSSRWIRWKGC